MKKHDTIATRLSLILTKLNNAEKFTVEELSAEFNVTKRTIQRDLNERLKNIPLQKKNGYYFLDEYYLGKVTLDDINSLAKLSGISKMFPSFTMEFSQHLLQKDVSKAYLIKTDNFEDISHKVEEFKLIEKAIIEKRILELIYREKRRVVHPYKFANVKGIWYVVALQDKVIKTFTFTKISNLQMTNDSFVINQNILEKIENEESLWFSNSKTEVILRVNSSISPYFKRRKVMPYQKILQEYKDGSLKVSVMMTFENEILQKVQYWLPNITIVSPTTLKDKLKKNLLQFLNIK